MKRSNRLVILVGVLLAVLAFVGIVVLLNNPNGNNQQVVTPKVTVLVAKADIAIGTAVTPDMVDEVKVDPDAVLGTRFGSASQLTGRPVLYDIAQGGQVSQDAFGSTGAICIECQLKAGEKAIAFQVDPVTGLAFLVQPGDHVDIVLAQDVQPVQQTQDSIAAQRLDPKAPARWELVNGLNNVRTVKTILQDRRVLYVSYTPSQPAPSTDPNAPAAAIPATVIIIFAGSDQDAELIKFAQSKDGEAGALTAVLRDTQDTAADTITTGVTLELLIQQYGVTVPNVIPLPSQQPR